VSLNQISAQIDFECEIESFPVLKDPILTHKPLLPDLDITLPLTLMPIEEDKYIYWVHGLGGNPERWAPAAFDIHMTYKTVRGLPTYFERDLAEGALELQNNIGDVFATLDLSYPVLDHSRDFVIAHSQGGIVSRWLDMSYGTPGWSDIRRYHGLVTFGSPHQGAQIIASAVDGTLYDLIGYTCESLIGGPTASAIEDDPLLDFLLPEETFQVVSDILCGFVEETIAPIIFEDFTVPITDDYKPGSDELATMNAYESTIPIINFYGVEEDPVVWHTMSSALVDPSIYDPWMGGDGTDETLVNSANYNQDVYYSHWLGYYIEDEILDAVFAPWVHEFPMCMYVYIGLSNLCAYDIELTSKMNEWYEGYEYWLLIDDLYKTAIGALTSETVFNGYGCECWGDEGGQWYNYYTFDIVDDEEDCDSPNPYVTCTTWPSYTTEFVEEENDGVVVRGSALGCPDRQEVPDLTDLKLNGCNHFQLRNSPETLERLQWLFDEDNIYTEFFHTELR
jgi:hypothetical protein